MGKTPDVLRGGELRPSSVGRTPLPRISPREAQLRLAAMSVVGEAVLDGTAPVLVGQDLDPGYHKGLEMAIRGMGLGSSSQAEDSAQPPQRPSTVNPFGSQRSAEIIRRGMSPTRGSIVR